MMHYWNYLKTGIQPMQTNSSLLYSSALCSSKDERSLLIYNPQLVGLQIQKYHRLLAKGFAENGVSTQALSYHPGLGCVISSTENDAIENGIAYHYIVPNNDNFARLKVVTESYRFAKVYFEKHKNAALICDVLTYSVSMGAVLAARKAGVPSFGIITDFPEQLSEGKKLYSFLVWKLINMCSGYVVLTEQMKEKMPGEKPIIVMEGHVDSGAVVEESIDDSYGQKICIYAGALHRRYGIDTLVKAFETADIEDAVLFIFGDGDYAEELKNNRIGKIKYFGIVPNAEVV